MNKAIKLQNVTKAFASKIAVDSVNLDIEGGKITGFLGPNGAGKTTTINMIVGILSPTHGKVTVNGYDVTQDGYGSKKLISYIPDNPLLYETMTGFEYLNFIANVYQMDPELAQEEVEKYAKIFELDFALDQTISGYSHGMQQKLALIGGLIHDPDYFILDEPMVGLDPKSSFNLKEIMRQRADDGKVVLFSTHVMEVAQNVCDDIIIINNGKIIARGSVEEIKELVPEAEGNLEKIFLELTKND